MYKKAYSLGRFLMLLILVACGGEPAEVTIPNAPTGIAVAPVETGITITWESKSNNENNFIVYRAEADPQSITGQVLTVDDLKEYAQVDKGKTSFTDTEVNPNKEYIYAVSAKNTKGENPSGADLSNFEDAKSNPIQPQPPAGDFRLRILRNGDGGGTIISSPAGIDCNQRTGGDCNQIYAEGTIVSLTANPDSSSRFEGWGGACSGEAVTCQITIGSALADANGGIDATVSFRRTGVSIAVEKTGAGTGLVTSSPENINCGDVCEGTWAVTPITVVLRAEASDGSLFNGWTNCPTVEGTQGNFCRVSQNEPGRVDIGAEFILPPPVINTFTATPEKVEAGDDVTLSWDVSGLGDIELELFVKNDIAGDPEEIDLTAKAVVDTIVVNPAVSTTYTLYARNSSADSGRSEASIATVTVGDKPIITLFEADDDTILSGTDVELSWAVTGAGTIALSLSDDDPSTADIPVTGDGFTVAAITEDVSYTLTATSDFGEAVSAPLLIDVGTAPAFTAALSADDDTVVSETDVELDWTISGAEKVELSGGEIPVATPRDVTLATASRVVTPESDTPPSTVTYTVTATNEFGEVVDSIDIEIGEAASITASSFKAADSDLVVGEDVDLSWAVTGTDPVLSLERTEAAAPTVVTPIPLPAGATSYTDEGLTAGSYSYTLVVSNDYGDEVTATLAAPVVITGVAPGITLFTVEEAVITFGQDVNLKWEITGTDPMVVIERTLGSETESISISDGNTTYVDVGLAVGEYTYKLIVSNSIGPDAEELLPGIVTVN